MSTAAKTTRWIDGAVKPRREGVYQRRPAAGSYSCWNGQRWNEDAATPAAAARASAASRNQTAQWRGLAEPSSLPCATCKGHTIVDRGFDEEAAIDRLEECPDC